MNSKYYPGRKKSIRKENREDAANRAMKLLLFKNRTVRELTNRLYEEEYSREEVEAAIEYVSSFGYLNDRRYCESYCISQTERKSRRVVERELLEKGVEESIIREVLEELPNQEEEVLQNLLYKRYGDPHRMDEKEYRRAYGFLGRKGFSVSLISRAMREYTNV